MHFLKNHRLPLKHTPPLTDFLWMAFLTVMMSLTRLHHAETIWQLPDASVAVFFLAGLRLPSTWFLLWFLTEFLLIDFVALYGFNTSAYCFSAAYGFLIPAFAGVWWIGKQLSKQLFIDPTQKSPLQMQRNTPSFMRLLQSLQMMALTFVFASLSALYYFIVSNVSFFLLSGKFAHLNGWEYTQRVSMYFHDYWFAAAGYSCLAVSFILFVGHLTRPKESFSLK
jgi:ABC-type multidrug transport system fused ATPase/permease subunit